MGVCVTHFDALDESGDRAQLSANELPPHFGRVAEVDLYERLLKHAAGLYQTGDAQAITEASMHVRGVLAAMERSARQPVLAGTQKEHHDAIWAAVQHIRENPGGLFSIESVACSGHYSTYYFSRLFKQIIGVSPKEFCIRTRLERAQTLLRESDMSIEQIAADLGYSDMFFFSRQFKQRLGISPFLWRKSQNGGV